MYMNKAIILGNLVQTPELKTTTNGNQVTNFSIATNENYTDRNGEKKNKAQFHNVTAFGKPAEIISQYSNKGENLLIEGKIETDAYEKNGETKYSTKIIVQNFQLGKNIQKEETTKQPKPPEEKPKPKMENKNAFKTQEHQEEINLNEIPF